MNFPENQRTGTVAEKAVSLLFSSWSWTVGKDDPDVGYDLFVEPDQEKFKGQRFLIQVKGTSNQTSGNVVARVKRHRLRQYAKNPHPVFLIRALPDGTFYWLHVQPWARQNEVKLDGDGEARVKLPSDQTLTDKEAFVAYLSEIMRPASERRFALTDLIDERQRYLSSLDNRFGAHVSVRNGVECYGIFAKSEPATFRFEIKPADDPRNKESLKDAVVYGLPGSLNVDVFRLTGSDLFSAIGIDQPHRGTLTLGTYPTGEVTVCFYPGPLRSMDGAEFSLPALLFLGDRGFSISNKDKESLFDFTLKGEFTDEGTSVNINLGFRDGAISKAPIQSHSALALFGQWAEQALENDAAELELCFKAGRVPIPFHGGSLGDVSPLLYFGYLLGRLHKIARMLNSPLVLPDDHTLTEEEISDINLAYRLLKGERVSVNVGQVDFDAPEPPPDPLPDVVFFIQTCLSLDIAGQHLGLIPVVIDLDKSTIEPHPEPGKYRLLRNPGSNAYIYRDEHGRTDAKLARKKLEAAST